MNRGFLFILSVVSTLIFVIAWITRNEPNIGGQQYDNESFHTSKLKEKAGNCVAKKLFFRAKLDSCKKIKLPANETGSIYRLIVK